jgi:phosphate-selective porin OprO/OprP
MVIFGRTLRPALARSAALFTLAWASGAYAATEEEQEARIARLEAVVSALQAQVQGQGAVAAENAELKEQVATLQAQVLDLKTTTGDQIQDVRKTAASLPTVSLENGRPMFTTADGKFSAAIRGVAQFDAAHYDVSPPVAANSFESGTNFRRARLGVDGKVFGDWNYALWGEFGGSGGESAILNQAYVEYAGLRLGGDTTLRLRLGVWAPTAGLEDATSNTESLFLERPAVAELIRSLDAGDGRTGFGIVATGAYWYASGTLTGKVVGAPALAEFAQQQGFVARVAFDPLHGPDYDTHIGATLQGVINPPDTAPGPAVTESLRLRERPELRVDSNNIRLVDTGAVMADGLIAYGLEAGASWRNLYLAAEWFTFDVNRTAVGAFASPFDPSFSGWYVQAAWTLTGERHQWAAANGGFRGIRPTKNLDPSQGAWGAWEVAGRYSVLDLDDRPGSAGFAAPFGGVRGGVQKITSVGLNWYPNSVIRFLLDYQWTNAERLSATGAPLDEDGRTISLRSQFAF